MNSKVEKMVRLMVGWEMTEDANAERVALWDSLCPDERKQTNESLVFISFANATELISDPFKHSNEDPELPDIRTCINGIEYYFELGEITDEGLAKSIHVAQRTKMVSGCNLSQVDPLAKMLKQKCEKEYVTGGAPVDLLLYYWRQDPYEPVIRDHLSKSRYETEKLLLNSQFDRIWIYNYRSGKVLWKDERHKGDATVMDGA
jgi:hypothetical protein